MERHQAGKAERREPTRRDGRRTVVECRRQPAVARARADIAADHGGRGRPALVHRAVRRAPQGTGGQARHQGRVPDSRHHHTRDQRGPRRQAGDPSAVGRCEGGRGHGDGARDSGSAGRAGRATGGTAGADRPGREGWQSGQGRLPARPPPEGAAAVPGPADRPAAREARGQAGRADEVPEGLPAPLGLQAEAGASRPSTPKSGGSATTRKNGPRAPPASSR